MAPIYRATSLIGVLLLLLGLTSCSNESNGFGGHIMPDHNQLSGLVKQYDLTWQTVSADLNQPTPSGTSYNNLYVTSHYGYVGEIPNQLYGRIRSEYLTQFYCPRDFKFTKTPIDDRIDSVFLSLYYTTYTGDSIAPITVEAIKLSQPLPKSKYTLVDVSPYVSNERLGKVSYYAGRAHAIATNSYKVINIPLPRELGQELYDRSRKGDPVFASQAAFDAYFPGVYITTHAGTGSILRVHRTALSMYFDTEVTVTDKSGKEVKEKRTVVQQLSHTSEVPQLSRFANDNLDRLIAANPADGYSYIKSPAGVVTQLTLPTREIHKALQAAPSGTHRSINSLPLTLYGEPQGAGEYDLNLPSSLLLLPKDSVGSFFQQELTDITSPYTTFVATPTISGSTSYTFGNLSSLVEKHIATKPDEDLVLWVVPVDRTTATNNGSEETTSLSNLVLPSAIKLNFTGGRHHFKVVYTDQKRP